MNHLRWVALAVSLGLAACGGGNDQAAPSVGGADAGDPVARGQRIVESGDCLTCHGPDRPEGFGTSFEGLAGSEVELVDGSMVRADAEYLRRSIADPGAQVVAGYDVPMPENDLSDDEIADVVAYLQSL